MWGVPKILSGAWPSTKMAKVQITQKKRLPVQLVYFEEYNRIDKAFYREKQIQG
jgi:predicted GIY-YIG superfamily endonuclease